MSIPFILSLAYVLLVALVLVLALATPTSRTIKISVIAAASIFYVVAYWGAQNLRGWAHQGTPSNPFELHWAIIQEPNKINGEIGKIYILAQNPNVFGLNARPRLYVLPFSETLANEILEARLKIENGEPIQASLTHRPAEAQNPRKQNEIASTSNRAGENLHIKFQVIPARQLPPKRSLNTQ